MAKSKKDRVYVITGGAGGMGIEIAKKLSERGKVLLSDVSENLLKQAKHNLGTLDVNVDTMVCDVANKEHVHTLVKKVTNSGELAGVIHTAALHPSSDALKVMEVNLIGTVHLLDAFIDVAVENTVAVCFASISGHIAPSNEHIDRLLDKPLDDNFLHEMANVLNGDGKLAYRISKRGVLRLIQQEERIRAWGNKKARIVSISPGSINTAAGIREVEADPQAVNYMIESNPLKRMGKIEEVVALVDFLCSDKASYITGTDIRIDGGVTPTLLNK